MGGRVERLIQHEAKPSAVLALSTVFFIYAHIVIDTTQAVTIIQHNTLVVMMFL